MGRCDAMSGMWSFDPCMAIKRHERMLSSFLLRLLFQRDPPILRSGSGLGVQNSGASGQNRCHSAEMSLRREIRPGQRSQMRSLQGPVETQEGSRNPTSRSAHDRCRWRLRFYRQRALQSSHRRLRRLQTFEFVTLVVVSLSCGRPVKRLWFRGCNKTGTGTLSQRFFKRFQLCPGAVPVLLGVLRLKWHPEPLDQFIQSGSA